MTDERKLGRGFGDLVGGAAFAAEEVLHVPVGTIRPNRFQPRREISGESFDNLKASIAQDGILQPVVVRPAESGYELIAGERRWRAAQEIGLEVIPVIIRQADDERALELALIENIQREDLNPIDRAHAYRRLMNTFALTQEEAASRVGQERSTVANTLRLLDLPDEVQEMVRSAQLTMGHARALLALRDGEAILKAARKVVEEGLSVRDTEAMSSPRRPGRPRVRKAKPAEVRDLETKLRRHFGTKVEVAAGRKRGRIVIEYYSSDDLERILDQMGV